MNRSIWVGALGAIAAKIVTASEMPPFFGAKLRANGGNPADSMLARFGGSVTVHVPLSGKTMEFDVTGKCTAGC